jgi:hypothetical protein
MSRPPLPLLVVAAMFTVAMVWLVAASLRPRAVPTFAPGTAYITTGSAVDTVTIDARDPRRWRFFSFTRGPLIPPDSAGWDLAVRRFRVLPSGDAMRIDTVMFDQLHDIPPTGYQPTVFGRDSLNPAIERWYRYDWLSHLLRPKPEVYVIRTRAGQAVKLSFLSYYCPGPEPGCVTVRFAALP